MEANEPACKTATGLSRRQRKLKHRYHRDIEVLDLTDDNAYCTRCTHVLGAVEGCESAIYTLHRCGCVSIDGTLMIWKAYNICPQMFCGNCIPCLSNIDGKPMILPRIDRIICCKKSGCTARMQSAYRTWGLDCAICSRSLADLYGIRKPHQVLTLLRTLVL
ncbi:hypothetical protein CJF30_00010846 [Rutstroemia sp. NJR-2017a BBW]|nr:hypothetical protein CJF30_00010846 [Rutstroemia sp. NJR-2017a BBW]